MGQKERDAEELMAALFEGSQRLEQMTLMARLEDRGASLYRIWAENESNFRAREELIAAAEREEANAKLLRLMTQLKTECEKCHTSLAPDGAAFQCSFHCTFCPECAAHLEYTCPNCGGTLTVRNAA